MNKKPCAKRIRIATRKSQLALWQAHHVGQLLKKAHPGLDYVLVPLTTSGDRFQHDKLQDIGGKNLFVKELEQALLSSTADIAVHSMKDVPAELPEPFTIAAFCPRDNPLDALVSHQQQGIDDLPPNACIGTSSLRRQSQLARLRSDLLIKPLRGNIDTRLLRLEQGEFDGIILAAAGLERLQLAENRRHLLSIEQMLPACGQGVLGIECLRDNHALIARLEPLNDPLTATCISAERRVNARLGGNCHLPLAVYANSHAPQRLSLRAKVLNTTGTRMIEAHVTGPVDQAMDLADQCATQLINEGALTLMGRSD